MAPTTGRTARASSNYAAPLSSGTLQRSIRRVLPATADVVYRAVTDLEHNASYSAEVQTVTWTSRSDPSQLHVGDVFAASNRSGPRCWTSTSTVSTAEPGRRFAYTVNGREHPVATWTFDLAEHTATASATTVTYTVELGQGFTDTVLHGLPAIAQRAFIRRRLDHLAHAMTTFLERLSADLANATTRPSAQPDALAAGKPPGQGNDA